MERWYKDKQGNVIEFFGEEMGSHVAPSVAATEELFGEGQAPTDERDQYKEEANK
jgi:hypothetical protein